MKRFDVKVNDLARYWSDFEGDLSVYYHFVWDKFDSQTDLRNFIKSYIKIAEKYKIAVPINTLDNLDLQPVSLYPLYKKEGYYYYPTYLFVSAKDKIAQKIISIDPLISMENSLKKSNSHGSIPIRVELSMREDKLKLLCYIDNDVFNLWIDNKKTKQDPEIGGKNLWVDNSELAYLNTPRLNSFLRDLKSLCFKCGATEFEFENLGLNDFCEDGVMFNGKVVYYEDIVELLPPHQRIVL